MTFSIADEVFGEIMLLDALTGGIATGLLLMLFEESLVVHNYGRGMYGVFCEVWVMKQYGVLESWSRLYRINLIANLKKAVGFRNNGEVLISTRENGLVSYDPNSGRNTDLGIQGYTWSFFVHNYMESLILLKGNNVIPGGFLGGIGGL
ncbi:F-box/kelch-repeat protein At3g06240-like [Solanum tuberosum]|uniref:F-box family protein n=1 Tax=Solanum tuberosum TaxID=4113 RepID=M1ANF0_SOLTU|nr:PREDICTED: F-box/kelch-repeat protein At3g06240-like [Solanum tuberosum]